MKLHSTNYTNTFIEIADDCPATRGEIPPTKGDTKSIANLQFDLISKNPYEFTSDDVLFQVYAERKDIPENEHTQARKDFFSKGQPCFRTSPLTKRYGWGVDSDVNGKIALYGCETNAYQAFSDDNNRVKVKAMKSKK